MKPIAFLAIFLAILTASYLLVGRIRAWLLAQQILDIPNQRSSHDIPTPRGGGLAVVVLVLAAGLAAALFTGQVLQGLTFFLAGAVVAGLGWMDDVRSLSPGLRFGVQGLAALSCVLGLGYFQSIHIPLLGELRFGWVGVPITLLWIVGLINVFNFMDGIDGIAGGVSAAAALGWLALSILPFALPNPLSAWIALAVVAGCLGFLGHNWHPARIFMGDVCSTFLGFTLAVLPLLSYRGGGDELLVGTAIVWAFLLDAGLTFLRRLLKGERVFTAHRTHLYQRLVISGIPVPHVSTLYILLTLVGGLLALGWMLRLPVVPALLLPGMPLAWAALYGVARFVRKT